MPKNRKKDQMKKAFQKIAAIPSIPSILIVLTSIATLSGCPGNSNVIETPTVFTPVNELPTAREFDTPPNTNKEGPLPETIVEEPGIDKNDNRKIKRLIAFQILLFGAETYEELQGEMKRIKEAGANTVVVRVFHNRGDRFYSFIDPWANEGVYFKTDYAPVVADALILMTRAARENGLSIYAWMTTKYATFGDNNMGLNSYDFAKKEIVPSFGVALFDDEEVEKLVKIYQDLASYDIDGILFQDDLILKHAEGMGKDASRLFGKEIRPEDLYVSPYLSPGGTKYYVKEYTDEFWRWSAFKSKRLAWVVKRLMEGSREINPELKFAVNLSYESVLWPHHALAWLSQDIVEFRKAGVDYFFIMAYHRQMMKEKGMVEVADVRELFDLMCKNALFVVKEPERVVIKLQVSDWDTGLPIAEGELIEVASYLYRGEEISIAFIPIGSKSSLVDVKTVLRMVKKE